ncbi:FAD-binding oxidoreductase [Streptococcus thoraltensis]|uniref:NAD(P)/FAD-dependent oxidoreductase n=1 Tax=Streptococcus thoraltensis TaxID=55085 RepID=UPI00037DD6D9|nr:FAD-dependent oxidoreductase [Streptococcus thoraltensis]MDY4760640.1 FAD-dependent oxidoreductase [Streptococcus thoraltensis]
MKVAIIGAGIVGSTAAYYLSKEKDMEVTVFDYGLGQATKAAAGIISPWFSRRRNKAWYKMARLGADFYPQMVSDLEEDGFDTSFYKQVGIFLHKKTPEHFQDLYELAHSRLEESPLIGDLTILSEEDVKAAFPDLQTEGQMLYASGAARLDGAALTQTLLQASACPVVRKEVRLKKVANGYDIDNQLFDRVILATGAWLGKILEPLGYDVDVRPQKGQLLDYQFEDYQTEDLPVFMPEGELDVIPFIDGKVSVGASHENDKGFDLTVDETVLNRLESEAREFFPKVDEAVSKSDRIGIRAYTSDFSPFYGQVPDLEGVYVASGLGSSGLTTGPLIARELVSMLKNQEFWLHSDDYKASNYICHTVKADKYSENMIK